MINQNAGALVHVYTPHFLVFLSCRVHRTACQLRKCACEAALCLRPANYIPLAKPLFSHATFAPRYICILLTIVIDPGSWPRIPLENRRPFYMVELVYLKKRQKKNSGSKKSVFRDRCHGRVFWVRSNCRNVYMAPI